MNTTGIKIKKVREIKNIEQEYMAKQLGISINSYRRYEQLEANITPDLLRQIAEVLDVSPAQIEGFNEGMTLNYHHIQDHAMGFNQGTVHQYVIDKKIETLYENTIELLQDKIAFLEKKLAEKK